MLISVLPCCWCCCWGGCWANGSLPKSDNKSKDVAGFAGCGAGSGWLIGGGTALGILVWLVVRGLSLDAVATELYKSKHNTKQINNILLCLKYEKSNNSMAMASMFDCSCYYLII